MEILLRDLFELVEPYERCGDGKETSYSLNPRNYYFTIRRNVRLGYSDDKCEVVDKSLMDSMKHCGTDQFTGEEFYDAKPMSVVVLMLKKELKHIFYDSEQFYDFIALLNVKITIAEQLNQIPAAFNNLNKWDCEDEAILDLKLYNIPLIRTCDNPRHWDIDFDKLSKMRENNYDCGDIQEKLDELYKQL